MGISFDMKEDNSDQVLEQFLSKKEICLEKLGLAGERFAKELAPFDTVKLTASYFE